MTELTYEQLMKLMFDAKRERDNAKSMTEVLTNKWHSEWVAEYKAYEELVETLEKMAEERFGYRKY